MSDQSQWLTFAALLVPFIAGYSLVSYVVRKLRTKPLHPPNPDSHSPPTTDDPRRGDKSFDGQ